MPRFLPTQSISPAEETANASHRAPRRTASSARTWLSYDPFLDPSVCRFFRILPTSNRSNPNIVPVPSEALDQGLGQGMEQPPGMPTSPRDLAVPIGRSEGRLSYLSGDRRGGRAVLPKKNKLRTCHVR